MITTPNVDHLVEVITRHYETSPLLHMREIDAAIVGMPGSVRTSLRHLESVGISRHALRSVAACMLTVRLSDRSSRPDPSEVSIQAMHSVMGAVIALDGGSLPFEFERNDPDCCDFVNAGVIEACLELASRDPSSSIAATARRIVGLCFVNLAASGQIAPLAWPNPRELLDEIAALGTLFVEESPGYYEGTTRPDDIWNAYSKALVTVEDHGWSTMGSLRHIVAQSAEQGPRQGAIRTRVLH